MGRKAKRVSGISHSAVGQKDFCSAEAVMLP